MKKNGNRALAFLLVFCLCVSLLPISPVLALSNGNIAEGTVTEVKALSDISNDFEGAILEYHLLEGQGPSGRDAVRLDIYSHITKPIQNFGLNLAFDSDTVIMSDSSLSEDDYTSEDYVEYLKQAVEPAQISVNELLTTKGAAASGAGAGKLSTSSFLMTGGSETNANALFNLFALQVANSKTAGNTMKTLDFSIFVNSDTTGIKNWYKGVNATSYDFSLPDDYISANENGKAMKLCSVYFVAKEGKTISDKTFGLDSGSSGTGANGIRFLNQENTLQSDKIAFVGFPEAPPDMGTVKVKVEKTVRVDDQDQTIYPKADSGLALELTPTSKAADGSFDEKDATYDEATGEYTFTNVPTGSYNLVVSGSSIPFTDGKTYNVNYTSATPITVAKDTTTSQPVDAATITVVQNSYTFHIKAVNSAGKELTFGSKTTVSFGGSGTTPTKDGDKGYQITVGANGLQALAINGLTGYKDTTVSLNLINNGLRDITRIDSEDTSVATVSGTGNDSIVTVTMPMQTTNITVPLPIPEGVTKDVAESMTMTLKPVDGSSEELKSEVGSGIKTGASDIKVTADESGTVTDIKVSADVPDGAYDVTIGGAGIEDTKTTITVVTVYDNNGNVVDRVVNLGGTATTKPDGTVEKIEGGVTAAGDSAAAGSGKVDLTNPGEPLKKGDTTIGSGGATVENPSGGAVEEVTGGLNSDNVGDNTGIEKPAVVSDPLYVVKVKDPTVESGVAKSFEVEVYLKNLRDVVSGSFGMYFDPTIFNVSDGQSIVTLADPDLVEFNNAMLGDSYSNPEVRSNYVVFYWSVKENLVDKGAINAISETKIATITLPVKGDASISLMDNLQNLVDDRTIYTMDFAMTDTGKKPEMDAFTMSAAWRAITMTDTVEPAVHLSNDKATRGGFYQAGAYGYETYNKDGTPVEDSKTTVNYDVRMQFQLPDIMKNTHRADFWVTEQDKTGIDGAVITIYDKDPKAAAEADPAKVVATLTTKNGGYAYTNLKPGTYWYSITEDGHWAYPDGKAGSTGEDYDQFTLTADGISATGKDITGDDGKVTDTKFYLDGSAVNGDGTEVVRDYINPVMDPTTYHEVALEKDETEADPELRVSITSPTKAYNFVRYYFTLQPNAGYEWNIDKATQTMADLIPYLSAELYEVAAGTPDPDYRSGTPTTPTIQWDASKEQFYIEGTDIKGNPLEGDLRAGDLVLTAKKDIVKLAKYTVTATAGTGGTVEYAADIDSGSSLTITGTDGNRVTSGSEAAGTPYQQIIEALGAGKTTSASFTFKPESGHTIDKVVINGVAQKITDQQKSSSYTYRFANISSDQSIYVTFLDANGDPESDPYVSVKVGANGSMKVLGKKAGAAGTPDETLNGPAAKDYVIKPADADTLELTITPNGPKNGGTGKQYEIDTVLVDGVPLTAAEMGAKDTYSVDGTDIAGYINPLTIPAGKLGLGTGETHSVVVTFKPLGEDSTHAIVIARVADGFGNLTPVGTEIYPMSSTPTYTMTPANDDWTVKFGPTATGSVILDKDTDDEADKSADVQQCTDDGTASGSPINKFTYQMPALTKTMTTLDVVFSEVSYRVEGQIRVQAQKGDNDDVAPATLTFVRKADGDKDETTITVISKTALSATVADTLGGRLIGFQADIPEGTWKVTVHKQGYLDYIIDGFEVSKLTNSQPTKHIHFGVSDCDHTQTVEACGKTARPIPLTIGDAAGDGKAIAFNDASMVTSGWVASALPRNVYKGDVNESDYNALTGTANPGAKSNTTDMTPVKNNMYKKRVSTDYATFEGAASNVDVPVSTKS